MTNCESLVKNWPKPDKSGRSYDARSRQFGKAKLWSAAHFWGHRASFRASPPAQLTLQDLQQSDEGVYRCRVDFRNSPTRNLKVNLTVIDDRINNSINPEVYMIVCILELLHPFNPVSSANFLKGVDRSYNPGRDALRWDRWNCVSSGQVIP
ncbi:hypothetical protein G5I_04644 [Acromyrmex echinatior]|uniref:Immunoglobulin V-set domain-containing protein n=1 Tax=Acromyrmex echinatior TaxID=103372 RepID=F4WG71_ACREC|nr:hypothetical protein G5I_04644 [Acromyrmex echinatior]